MKDAKKDERWRRSSKPVAVIITLTWKSRRLRQYIGISIPPKHWSFKDQRVKSSVSGSAEINEKIKRAEKRLEQAYLEVLANQEIPEPNEIRAKYESYNPSTSNGVSGTIKREVDPIKVFDQYCQGVKNGGILQKKTK
ncbi:MAG: Arm DNA-binding domain-containing protein, partial [Bacteroidota bacterium]